MKIRSKLMAVSAVVLAGFAAITLSTLLSVGSLHDLNGLERQGRELKNEFLLFLLKGKELTDTGNLEEALQNWLALYENFTKHYTDFVGAKALGAIPEGKQKIEDFSFIWETTEANVQRLKELIEALIAKHNEGGTSFVTGLAMGFAKYDDPDFIKPLSTVNSLLTSLNDLVATSLSEIVGLVSDRAVAAESLLIRLSLGLAAGVSAVAFAFLVLFARSLTRRIRGIGGAMESLARKDFTVRLSAGTKDELGSIAAAINGFLGDFARVIEGVKSISSEAAELKNDVSSATIESSAAVTQMTANIGSLGGQARDLVDHLAKSEEAVRGIATGAAALLERIEGQALLIGRSTSSIEQMNASMRSVADIASRREQAARELVSVTKEGGAMIDETNLMVREIVDGIREITEIIAIIDGISNMTNLLSMNAAIEAAHAGSAGRGFSVVAEEIRKLADSTAENAKRIKAMIGGISGQIDQVLEKSESSKRGFLAVDAEVETTSRAMTEISAAVSELSVGAGEIMQATGQLADIGRGVREEAQRAAENAEAVRARMKSIGEIGETVRNGLAEIEIGTKDMNAAMVSVCELQTRSGDSIARLHEEVSVFKTS